MAEVDRRKDLLAAYENAAVVVSGVDAAQLERPTPCPGYRVAALIDHLVEAGRRAAAAGRGVAPPPGDDSPHVELPEVPADLRRSADEAGLSWADDSRLSSSLTMPWGEQYSGGALVDMYLAEIAIHTWDLARSTGQEDQLDPDVAPSAIEGARTLIKTHFRDAVAVGVPFGLEVLVPAGASDWDRLAAFAGRNPQEPLSP